MQLFYSPTTYQSTNPAHRMSIIKLRLGVHSLHIQTGKYENQDASVPVDERICLVCERSCIEQEEHFLMHCIKEYDELHRQLLYFHISKNDTHFASLTEHD